MRGMQGARVAAVSDPLDTCPQCSDPWCACDCALCEFITSTPAAARERQVIGEATWQLFGNRNVLDGKALRIAYYRSIIADARTAAITAAAQLVDQPVTIYGHQAATLIRGLLISDDAPAVTADEP